MTTDELAWMDYLLGWVALYTVLVLCGVLAFGISMFIRFLWLAFTSKGDEED